MANRFHSILSESTASFSDAYKIREALRAILTWENCADQLMRDVEPMLEKMRKDVLQDSAPSLA
jgi:hypothetical protein